MKKGWKNFWIACGVTAGVGLALCCVGIGMGATFEAINARFPYGIGIVGRGGYAESGSGTVDADAAEVFSGIQKIDMEVSGIYVEIAESYSNSEVRLETSAVESRLKLRYYQEGDELKIETRNSVIWRINNGSYGQITLYLPKYMMEEIDISLEAGELYADMLQARQLSVDIGAGEGTIEQFSASEADLDCGAGSITASGTIERELDVDCGIGNVDVTLDGVESLYNYELQCGIGEITVGDSSYSGISEEKDMNHHAHREVNIDCGIGEVKIAFGDS